MESVKHFFTGDLTNLNVYFEKDSLKEQANHGVNAIIQIPLGQDLKSRFESEIPVFVEIVHDELRNI